MDNKEERRSRLIEAFIKQLGQFISKVPQFFQACLQMVSD